MKVAHIVPTKLLWVIEGAEYHMCLGHLIGEDFDYTSFYKKEAFNGAYVIMDNGVYETGQPLPIEEICKKANMIGASEIILPDYYKDGEKSLEATREAIEYARNNFQGKLMAVPQGKDLEEWLHNAILTLSLDIDVLGVPKWLSGEGMRARLKALQTLDHLTRGREVHLLGCAENPIESQLIATAGKAGAFPEVRGIDSCIAYKYAEHNMFFEDGPRPEGEMDFNADTCKLECLVENIRHWDRLVDLGGNENER